MHKIRTSSRGTIATGGLTQNLFFDPPTHKKINKHRFIFLCVGGSKNKFWVRPPVAIVPLEEVLILCTVYLDKLNQFGDADFAEHRRHTHGEIHGVINRHSIAAIIIR